MNAQTIRLDYQARPQFRAFHRRSQRFAVVVAHRRAGKTVASIFDLVDAALRCQKKNGRFAYIAPYYAQAKDVVWTYLKNAVAEIPGIQVNESELRVDLPNGARVRLYGADNYDRMRGIYLDGVVLDEYADMPSAAWSEVIRPALSDRLGWAVFIGTPKGRNAFAELYERAALSDEWFSLRLRASETGIIAADELAALQAELSRNEYRREMETDFDAAVEGAYYADQLDEARDQNRVTRVSPDPLMSIRIYADLGGPGAKADAFAMWVVQFVGREVRVLNYYEATGQPPAEHFSWLRSKGYGPGKADIFLPHDGLSESGPNPGSWESAFREAGWSVDTLRNEGSGKVGARSVRIEATRRLLPSCWFNEETTRHGLSALSAYAEKRDEKRGVGLGPDHNWASHGADAFGLMCVAYEKPTGKPKTMNMPSYGAV